MGYLRSFYWFIDMVGEGRYWESRKSFFLEILLVWVFVFESDVWI